MPYPQLMGLAKPSWFCEIAERKDSRDKFVQQRQGRADGAIRSPVITLRRVLK